MSTCLPAVSGSLRTNTPGSDVPASKKLSAGLSQVLESQSRVAVGHHGGPRSIGSNFNWVMDRKMWTRCC